jgi:hypothetical protein
LECETDTETFSVPFSSISNSLSKLNDKVLCVVSGFEFELREYCPTTLTGASFNDNSLKVVRNSLKQTPIARILTQRACLNNSKLKIVCLVFILCAYSSISRTM